MQIPLLVIFYLYTDDIILLLGWGDEHVAMYAQQYVRIYIFSDMLDHVQEAVGNLLETTGHEIYSTVMGVIHEATVVAVIVIVVLTGFPLTIQIVAWICLATSIFYLILSVGLAAKLGWLKPFQKGMCRNLSLNVRTFPVLWWLRLSLAEMCTTHAAILFSSCTECNCGKEHDENSSCLVNRFRLE